MSRKVALLPEHTFISELPNTLLAFGDQGNNLAGNLFQFSLVPYLGFLYFLNYEKNETPELVQFGFTYLLLFVAATIPTGILAKNIYGISLADADWLHGGAESLLSISNILIVIGFRQALKNTTTYTDQDDNTFFNLVAKISAGFILIGVINYIFFGIQHLEAHSPFLQGIGNLDITRSEPINALSIPTWIVHFSSVSEFVLAIRLANQFGILTNPKWRGFALGMLPSHASGICACTYHLFYNSPNLKFLVTTQAALTFLGNLSLCFVAYRLAASNGYLFPWQSNSEEDNDSNRALRYQSSSSLTTVAKNSESLNQFTSPDYLLLAEIFAFSILGAYTTKYGSLAILDYLQVANPLVATALIFGIPVAVASISFKDDSNIFPSI